jgi:hypothetical protein
MSLPAGPVATAAAQLAEGVKSVGAWKTPVTSTPGFLHARCTHARVMCCAVLRCAALCCAVLCCVSLLIYKPKFSMDSIDPNQCVDRCNRCKPKLQSIWFVQLKHSSMAVIDAVLQKYKRHNDAYLVIDRFERAVRPQWYVALSQVARDSQGGETDAEAPASFVYGANSACTGICDYGLLSGHMCAFERSTHSL